MVYVPDSEPDSVFVITAYDLIGKPLAAFRRAQKQEPAMTRDQFPEGWDEEKIRRVLSFYEQQTEDDAVIEDEAGLEAPEAVMNVPHDLVPKVRELIAKRGR